MPERLLSHAKVFQVLLSVTAILMSSLCGTVGLLLSAGLLILKVRESDLGQRCKSSVANHKPTTFSVSDTVYK